MQFIVLTTDIRPDVTTDDKVDFKQMLHLLLFIGHKSGTRADVTIEARKEKQPM